MNLLLVDDEVAMVQIMKEAVDWKRQGIKELYTAHNADEAKDILESTKIDILVCDIEMPGESGLELIKWMEDIYPEIISIILTGARIPLAMLLTHAGMGLNGIWWALSLTSIVKGIIFTLTFRQTSRTKLN